MIELSPNTPDEAAQVLASITQPSALADFLAANLQADTLDKQRMLEELNVEKRLQLIGGRLATQLDVLELQNKIQSQVKESIDKSQRALLPAGADEGHPQGAGRRRGGRRWQRDSTRCARSLKPPSPLKR